MALEEIRPAPDRGVAGFRIDVTHAIVKDAELRDNPAPSADDHPEVRRHGQVQMFSMNRPEVHDVLRRWRALASAREPERILVGRPTCSTSTGS